MLIHIKHYTLKVLFYIHNIIGQILYYLFSILIFIQFLLIYYQHFNFYRYTDTLKVLVKHFLVDR